MTDEPQRTCPTPTAHRRLEEVHRFWHECADSYQNPEEFRAKLNACIQAARNLTFALQKEGELIPDFSEWYAPWQAKMKADRVMKWLHDSRTQIVHRGDLTIKSRAVVRLQLDYADAGREVAGSLPDSKRPDTKLFEESGVRVNPLSTLTEILQYTEHLDLPERIRQEATITVERRWVERNLPDMELLDSLAHVYGFLSTLVSDAHKVAGVEHGLFTRHEGKVIRLPELTGASGRLPCMVTSRALRSMSFRYADGIPPGGKLWTSETDEAGRAAAWKKYGGFEPPTPPDREPASPIDLLPMYVRFAVAILESGEDHGWFIFYYQGPRLLGSQILLARDAADKRDLAQRIAEVVAVNGVDGIIEVGEVWHAPMTVAKDGAFVRPAEHPDRTEALAIWAETSDSKRESVHIPFKRRRFRHPLIGEPVYIGGDKVENNFLDPVRRVWASWRSADGEPSGD